MKIRHFGTLCIGKTKIYAKRLIFKLFFKVYYFKSALNELIFIRKNFRKLIVEPRITLWLFSAIYCIVKIVGK